MSTIFLSLTSAAQLVASRLKVDVVRNTPLVALPLGLDLDADQSQTVLIDTAVDATTSCSLSTFASSCSMPLAICSSGVVPVSWVGSEVPVVESSSRAAVP
jgi:hypothetical protein